MREEGERERERETERDPNIYRNGSPEKACKGFFSDVDLGDFVIDLFWPCFPNSLFPPLRVGAVRF